MTVRQMFFLVALAVSAAIALLSLVWSPAWWLFAIVAPLILLGLYDCYQVDHALLRLYPVIGRFRYMFESVRPEIQQYFVESDTNGMPVSREFRSLIYQRAKGERDTRPFGTIFDVNSDGYEWVDHSLAPTEPEDHDPRIRIGGADCKQPYDASPLNISAMSYGSLSKNAIMALNKGAREGGFAHNTGEGGLSPYHLKYGGDIIWQIGTGYFGCRTGDGRFDEELFRENATRDVVKMIEVKLSQGAKPGHGGILPAVKLTPEIAEIRRVPMGKDVISPAAHTEFSTPRGLLEFVARLRRVSGGKPVGFKLCVGRKSEFLGICKAMLETGILPDFITIDGGEGGTGAAPTEMTNSVGMPLRDALIFVNSALIGVSLREQIRIIVAGKILSAFHLLRVLALGADTANAARGMMFALGCLQSRACNTDRCPTGVATQNPARYQALDVEGKSHRVARYHRDTIRHLVELLGAAGLSSLDQLRPHHINHRVKGTVIRNYAELYPELRSGCLLDEDHVPADWEADWLKANASHW